MYAILMSTAIGFEPIWARSKQYYEQRQADEALVKDLFGRIFDKLR
jgi:hypothetical protein